jgi:hypothetical protein
MRIVLGLVLVRITCCAAPDRAADAIGIWNVSQMRSMNPYPHSLTVRFQTHAKGEVFALDRTDARWITASRTFLYFDGEARDYRGGTCSGTQSSRRVDRQTIEILQRCATDESTRFVRRASGWSRELILDISEEHPDGHVLRRHLILGDNAAIRKLEP